MYYYVIWKAFVFQTHWNAQISVISYLYVMQGLLNFFSQLNRFHLIYLFEINHEILK